MYQAWYQAPGMLDRKGLLYSSQKGIFEVEDNGIPVMIGHFTSHNLYKVSLDSSSNNFQIIPSRVITAGTSTSVANPFVWHRRFAHLTEAFVKRLADIASSMVVTSSPNTLPFCSVCIEAKMTRQPNREPRLHSTTAGFRPHADVGGGGDTYTTFRVWREGSWAWRCRESIPTQ